MRFKLEDLDSVKICVISIVEMFLIVKLAVSSQLGTGFAGGLQSTEVNREIFLPSESRVTNGRGVLLLIRKGGGDATGHNGPTE
jgi:hypothetical protein